MQEYLLLYNLFGYPSQGSKRALLRCTVDNPSAVPVKWRLMSHNNIQFAEGEWKKEPRSFGMESWSADFSCITFPELYTLQAEFSDGQCLISEIFDVARMPYLNQIGLRLSISNAKARYARGTKDGGFYDCNSRMGEAYSHGVFLNGLCWFDYLHRDRLTPQERAELRWAEQTAFDYLMNLRDEKTGEFSNYSDERPFETRNFGLFNSVDALYGLSAYESLIGPEDPQRCTPVMLTKLEKSFNFIFSHPDDQESLIQYTKREWLPVIACHFYRFSGKESYLEQAREWLLEKMPDMDLRDMPRGYWLSVNAFEGMALVKALSPDLAEDPRWEECLRKAGERMQELMERNAYHFPPPVDHLHSAQAWDHMDELPAESLGNLYDTRWFGNNDISLWGIQACYLALLTGDKAFERSAAAAVNFVCGLNFGLPGNMVNPPSDQSLTVASFLAQTDRSAKPWKIWYVRLGANDWISLVNGYSVHGTEAFYTDEDFINGETFIKTDGLFLYLISLYECLLNGELPELLRKK